MRSRPSTLHARTLIALLALAPSARAEGELWTVGPLPGHDFDTIQLAVNAAAEGDFIFVEAGTYPSFVVDDKSLTVIASPSADVECGTIRVRDLAAGKACVFRGLRATGLSDSGGVESCGGLVADCDGAVWFEDCALRSHDLLLQHGAPALDVLGSAQVAVAGGSVTGGTGTWIGGHGIRASDARLALYAVEVQGGQYGGDCDGADGGDGISLAAASFLFVSGGSIHGGDGSDTYCYSGCGGDGGSGITIAGGSTVELSNVDVDGGSAGLEHTNCWPCCDGTSGASIVGGTPVQYDELQRTLATPRFQLGGDRGELEFHGVPGDAAFLLVSSRTDFLPLSRWSGVALIYKPDPPMNWNGGGASVLGGLGVHTGFLGIVPPSGVLSVPLVAPLLPPEAAGSFVQAYAVSAMGDPVIGQPSRIVFLRSDQAVPDCNGNGIADPADIAGGASADCDGDGIPDECLASRTAMGTGSRTPATSRAAPAPTATSTACRTSARPTATETACPTTATSRMGRARTATGTPRRTSARPSPTATATACRTSAISIRARRST